jgi:hypothetical protein
MRKLRSIKLIGKPSGKHPLGRMRISEDKIKMDIREMDCQDGMWLELAHVHRWD